MLRLTALLILLPACSLAGDDAEVIVTVQLSPQARDLTPEVEIDGEVVATAGRDPGLATTGTVAARGSVAVECTVSRGASSTTGRLRLDLNDGWRYPVTCAVQADDPADLCFGCRGSEPFDLDPGLGMPDQRLWVVWAGDPIDNPPIY